MIGQTISHCHIIEKLAEGGMSVVIYRVENTQLESGVTRSSLLAWSQGSRLPHLPDR